MKRICFWCIGPGLELLVDAKTTINLWRAVMLQSPAITRDEDVKVMNIKILKNRCLLIT